MVFTLTYSSPALLSPPFDTHVSVQLSACLADMWTLRAAQQKLSELLHIPGDQDHGISTENPVKVI